MMEQHDQDDQRDRYSKKPQENRHGSILSSKELRELTTKRSFAPDALFAPGTVAGTASLCGGERGRERPAEQRQRQQDRKFHRPTPPFLHATFPRPRAL